jgi:hypothetical protein
VDLLTAMSLGAAGGLLVLLIFWHGCVVRWREARRQSRQRQDPDAPRLDMYVDIWPDILAGVTQVVLGAAAGAVFHQQVTGVAAAIAVGAAAPALLQQLGNSRNIREAVQGGPVEPAQEPAP